MTTDHIARGQDLTPAAGLMVKDCIGLVLDYASTANENELPGLTAALGCMLSIDATPAHKCVEAARRNHARGGDCPG
jgi:hypothetical protein